MLAARQVLDHAAARGARAETVGFNHWMVTKVIRVAAIPNAGPILEPEFHNEDLHLRDMIATLHPGDLWTFALGSVPSSLQAGVEMARIPDYLESANRARAGYLLDYRDWDSIHGEASGDAVEDPLAPMLTIEVHHAYSNWFPFVRTFYRGDAVHLSATNTLEAHYALYIDEYDWER